MPVNSTCEKNPTLKRYFSRTYAIERTPLLTNPAYNERNFELYPDKNEQFCICFVEMYLEWLYLKLSSLTSTLPSGSRVWLAEQKVRDTDTRVVHIRVTQN